MGGVLTVIDAVADKKGVDATDLPPLDQSIDPDALERLFDRDNASGMVSFEYAGTTVRVFDNGVVVVNEWPERQVYEGP